MSNATLESIHQVIGYLVRTFNISTQTYVEKNYPRKGILAAAAFGICSTTNRKKCYSPGKLIFVHDIILPIKHRVDWELIRQKKQAQINRGKNLENKHRVYYDCKVVDDNILTNHTA